MRYLRNTILGALFLSVFLLTQWAGRSFDWMQRYPQGRGFPVLLDAFPGLAGTERREIVLRELPLDPAVLARDPSPLDLPTQNPDPGLMRNDYVDYRRMQSDGRDVIEMRHYPNGWAPAWHTASYELQPGGVVVPLAIRGGGGLGALAVSPTVASGAVLLAMWFARRRSRTAQRPAAFIRRYLTRIDLFCFVLLLAPFAYYAFVLIQLTPSAWPDSVLYLWRRPIGAHFFAGRSPTQRVIFRLLADGNPSIAAMLQLFVFAAACVGLFLLLRNRGRAQPGALAVVLALLFSSYLLSASAILVAAEPIFLALMLVFPVVLLAGRGNAWMASALTIGVLFIFSKNTAPYLALTAIACALVLDFVRRGSRPRGAYRVYAALAVVSTLSIANTMRADPSLHLNTMASVQAGLLPNPRAEQHLIERWDMPGGAYLDQVRGRDVLVSLDGSPLFTVDGRTLDIRLLDDSHGYVDWIRRHGRKASMDYRLRAEPMETLREYTSAFALASRGDSLDFMADHLGPVAGEDTEANRRTVAKFAVNDEAGWLGFDPFHVLRAVLPWIGFGNVWSLALIMVGAVVLVRFAPQSTALRCSLPLFAMGLAGFFMSHFGDAPNDARHDFPAFAAIELGAVLLLLACAEIAVEPITRQRAANAASQRRSNQ